MFSNMSNTTITIWNTSLLISRLRRQLLETYRKDELTVMVGKIWILDKNQETVKIKEVIQAQFCRLFNSHKVSYNNNIFYVTYHGYSNDVSVEDAQQQLSQEMSKAIRKVANPDRTGRDNLLRARYEDEAMTSGQYEEFFDQHELHRADTG